MEVLEFKDPKPVPDIVHTYNANQTNTVVIDNGSYQCRVGWLNQTEPLLVFRNLIAKPRKERTKKDCPEGAQTPQLQVGNDIINIEAVRFQLKTQFDRNVVTHFEAQEHLLDYTFTHLGINTEKCVPHPVVLTEAFLNPNSSRQLMSELLFECYGVPSLTYGIDSLYAYSFSQTKPAENALIVSLGYHTIHIIPVLKNQAIFANTRRINTGGYHLISFLHRILQLKYPAHANAVTLSRAEELLHSICAVAIDYKEELNRWTDSDYYENNIRRIQLPYSVSTVSVLTLEQQKERKKELAKRLAEINARKREERLAEDEEKLNQLLAIQEMIDVDDDDDMEDIEKVLNDHQIKNLDELHKNITLLNARIEKTKEKIVAANTVDDIVVDEPPAKQTKYSKMVFENEKAMQAFLQNVKKMRQDILNKKSARKQRRQDMAKRRTAAGQERMRIISQLARKEKGHDDFGLRDEDWDIYKTISREGGDSDSEAENDKLLEMDELIRTHEPSEVDESLMPGESYQLHIGVERYRAPELLFKPYMMGSAEAGLTEVVGYVLSLFNAEDQLKLAGNVVLVGGLANLPGLSERIRSDLVSIRPFKSYSNVQIINNPNLSAWHGMRKWARSSEFKRSLVTRQQYEEYGSEYFKTHIVSNPYVPSPKGHVIDVCE